MLPLPVHLQAKVSVSIADVDVEVPLVGACSASQLRADREHEQEALAVSELPSSDLGVDDAVAVSMRLPWPIEGSRNFTLEFAGEVDV